MKPENKAHGQFTYFQAIIEDSEYLVLNFNDKCSLHLSVTEDTLIQFYKEIDDEGGNIVSFDTGGDNDLRLIFDEHYIYLQFSSEIEIKEFFAYFKKEIESSLELDKQSILKAETRGGKTIIAEDSLSLLSKEEELAKIRDMENFKIYKNAMRNKSYTDIEKDFQKIVDEIPLKLRMNYYKLFEPINQCFGKYISEITKVPIGNVWSLFGRMKDAQSHHFEGFEKEDIDLINFSRDFYSKFVYSLQFHNEVIREAKSQVISIVGKELEKHDKITRSKIKTILYERGFPVAGVIDAIYEKYRK